MYRIGTERMVPVGEARQAVARKNVTDRRAGEAGERCQAVRYEAVGVAGGKGSRPPVPGAAPAATGRASSRLFIGVLAWRTLRAPREIPEVAVAGRQRQRLLTRLEQLKKQHSWGDLGDAEYQAQRDATRAALAELPDGDRITAFDAYRARILALPDAIAAASPARREELCRIVVQRVIVRDRQVEAIDWVPPARPFFKRQRECPQGDEGARPLSDDDSLAWYVA